MPASLPVGVDRVLAALGDRRARPNLRWSSALAGRPPEELAGFAGELVELRDTAERVRAAHQRGGRSFYAQFRAPFDLYLLVRVLRPQHVVETGVSSGVSSAFFLRALRRNGQGVLHSIDTPVEQARARLGSRESPVSVPPGNSSGWAVPTELRRGWDLRIGPSQEILPRLVRSLPRVDLFLHDSEHTPRHLTFELESVRRKLRAGAVVLADNTAWTGSAFDDFARSLGAPVRRRGRSDLVGLRLEAGPPVALAHGPRRRPGPRATAG